MRQAPKSSTPLRSTSRRSRTARCRTPGIGWPAAWLSPTWPTTVPMCSPAALAWSTAQEPGFPMVPLIAPSHVAARPSGLRRGMLDEAPDEVGAAVSPLKS